VRPLFRSTSISALLVWATLLFTQHSRAEGEPDAGNRTAARDLAGQAADAFDSGQYALALDRFTRADQLYPAPTLSFMRARCLFMLGRWVEAFERFNETARIELTPDAPEPFHRAVSDAAREARELEVRLPRIRIVVPRQPGVSVIVDELPLPVALHGVSYPIDPGTHRVRAEFGDDAYFDQALVLEERDDQVVDVPPPPRAEAERVSLAPSSEGAARGSSVPAWVVPTAFAAGGLGTATAIVSLVLGTRVQSDLDEACDTDGACPVESADELQSFRHYQALFISGGALGVAGIGVGLYFVLGDTGDGGVGLQIGPAGTRLSGSF
jgi:hypothetical protein